MTHTILHVTLEYKYAAGGLGVVINGLLPALQENGVYASVITPYYDFYKYPTDKLQQIITINHLYKKVLHTSLIYMINSKLDDQQNAIPHYLVKPNINSSVAYIFNVGDPFSIYKEFDFSYPQNRIEYFAGAVAALIRIQYPTIPIFDVIHTHCWQTALTVCLIKEFEQLSWVKKLALKLHNVPKVISTIHLLCYEQGILTSKQEIIDVLTSVGLPLNTKLLINNKHLNQMYLGLQYSDQVTMVSKGCVQDVTTGLGYGLDFLYNNLNNDQRLHGITNGHTIKKWDATLSSNLGIYALTRDFVGSKQKIKKFLLEKYFCLNSDPAALWFLFVGRFSFEKGIDMLPYVYEAIVGRGGNLIIMGYYAVDSLAITNLIASFKAKKNIIVIDTKAEQDLFGKYFRAAADFTIVPSHAETCGLVPMEAMANASIPITSYVQGLKDTIISLSNLEHGTGFFYDDDQNRIENLTNIINIAWDKYVDWHATQTLNDLLIRLHKKSASFDWLQQPVKQYLALYDNTLKRTTTLSSHSNEQFPVIKILHVALEYKEAFLGGIATVTTELVDAQNKFKDGTGFEASIVTPYYSQLFLGYTITYLCKIVHVYNNMQVESSVYLSNKDNNKHFLIKPCASYEYLFNINTGLQIYGNLTKNNNFIERIKYFNSATAAFVARTSYLNPDILQLHSWHTALTAVLLRDVYKFNDLKIAYMMHANNNYIGKYSGQQLTGIGLYFLDRFYILQQMGLDYSNYIISVSPNLLLECSADPIAITSETIELKHLRKSLLQAIISKTAIGILNGINYKKHCFLDNEVVTNRSDSIVAYKNNLKEQLAIQLMNHNSLWKIDHKLPVILYVGRFSAEKGVAWFKDLINAITGKAIFFAIGTGVTKEVLELILNNSRQTDNVFITFSMEEQKKYGAKMRAIADFTFVPSYIEGCGLSAMEGFANGSLCITSGVGGLQDFIKPFKYNPEDQAVVGNGFIYNNQDVSSLVPTITAALNLWHGLLEPEKDLIYRHIIEYGKKFDWLAVGGAVEQYLAAFKDFLTFREGKKFFRRFGY